MITLKPGFLVALKTAIRGGVEYRRKTLEQTTVGKAGRRKRWETVRVVRDAEEYRRAVEARSQATQAIRRVASMTSFGMIVPLDREADLEQAEREAQARAGAFNSNAQYSRVEVFMLKGRIAETDEQATRAIASEVSGLLRQMEAGIASLDVASIRDAANKARSLAQALDAKSAAKMGKALRAARKAAREISLRVEKKGEDAKRVLRSLDLAPIQALRFALLDADEPAPERDEISLEQADSAPRDAQLPMVSSQRFANLETD